MTKWTWYVVLSLLGAGCSGEAVARALLIDGNAAITAPRFAEGDIDGDGRSELVAGGRVGRFRAVTDPFAAKTARVEVYAGNSLIADARAASENLHVVNDVAVGDVDGDGRAEIVAIGDYRVYVLEYGVSGLKVSYMSALADGRFLRVAVGDVDGDGRAEIAIAESRPESGGESPVADIRVFGFSGRFEALALWPLEQSVGDLCFGDFDGDGQVDMAVEQGGEEVGGQIGLFGFDGVQPYERFTREVTEEQVRVLNLSARRLGDVDVLGVGDVRGLVQLMRLDGSNFSVFDQVELPRDSGFVHGLHLTQLFGEKGLQVICGTAPAGAAFGRLWLIDRMGY